MITVVNSENSQDYRRLFAKASKALGFTYDEAAVAAYTPEQFEAWWEESKTGTQRNKLITSLSEYFQNIKTIVTSTNDFTYVRLPLDEPAFEIDANSRLITVPDEFKQNGISVKGDEGAEIVFFRIDRYFDSVDLGAEDTDVLIQWESAGNTFGISRAIIKDIESQPGKLIFGWYIDNDITTAAGTIKFSVRIYKTNAAKEEIFNFSTLTATATIQQALDYELNESIMANVTQDEDCIRARLIDSPATSTDVTAHAPVYYINIVNDASGSTELDATAEYWFKDGYAIHDGVLYTSSVAGTVKERGKKLSVNAVSDDGGVISYAWYKYGLNDTSYSNGVLQPSALEYAPFTSSSKFQAGYVYFYKITSSTSVVSYEEIPSANYTVGDEIVSEFLQDATVTSHPAGYDDTAVYTRNSFIVAGGVGFYKAIATNHLGKSRNSANSEVAKVPGPGPLTIAPNTQHDGANNRSANGTAHAFFSYDEDEDTYGTADPQVSVTTDSKNTVTYTWSYNNQIFTDETGNTIDIDVPTSAADRKKFDQTYKVSVVAERNKTTTDPQELSFRVTDKAQVIPNSKPTSGEGAAVEFTARLVSGTPINLNDYLDYQAVVCDRVTYQWVSVKGTNVGDNEEDISGATGQSYTPTAGCIIACHVTNEIVDGKGTTNEHVADSTTWYTPKFIVANA